MSAAKSGPVQEPNLPPGWDVQRLHRLLFGALSTLAKRGWIVRPDDVHDLIQGFLVRLWDDLLSKWDGERSSFATYVHNQFVWFAKSRLLDERRFRQKQVDFEALRYACRDTSSQVETGELTELIRKSLHRLPRTTRAVLSSYLGADRPSERDLAAKFKTTRHDIRNHLADGFGRILIGLPRPADISQDDWEIFDCLYRQGLTIAETSQQAHRQVSAIQQIRNSLLSRLTRSIRQ